MGIFFADLVVEGLVLVELKAVKLLDAVQDAQCMNYLRASGLSVCLLVYLYRPKVEIRRSVPYDVWNTGKPKTSSSTLPLLSVLTHACGFCGV